MSRHESSHPAMRVQRSRFGSIDSYREGGPRSRSPSPRGHRRHHRSPPSRRFSHRSHRSPSPRRFSRRYSPSYYPRQRSRSPGRRSESSVEKYLRDVVENGIGTSLPADSLSNVNRDDLADGPIFSRALSHPWNLERGIFREENPSRPFSMRHDEDSYNRDIFIAQLDRSINSEFLQHQSRENKRGGEQESKYFQYDREDRLFDESIKSRALLAETEKYCKQSLNKSPSLMYMDEDFRKLERIRRKREEDLRSRNISTDYPMPDSANQGQSSESQHHYRSEKTPAVPLKSILKKRSDDSSIQDSRNFSEGKKPPESTSKSVNQRSDFLLPYEKASQDGSGFSCILGTTTDSTYAPEKSLDPFPDNIEDEEKFLYGDDDGDSNNCFYSQKIMMSEKKEPVSEKVKSPPTAKPKNLEQSVKRENLKLSVKRENLKQSVKRENLEQSVKRENLEQSVKPENLEQSVKPENLEQSVKPENLEQSNVEYDKIRDLLKTIGLDIGMAEIDKLAARTEERLHGKKTAYSPNNHSVANHKAKLWERQKHSLSPFDSFPSPEAVSPVLKSDYNNIAISGQNKATDMCEQSGVPGFLIPSAPPSFLDIPPGPISGSCQYVPYVSTFTPTQFFPNSASLPVALPDYDVYQHHMGYATSDWCAQQMNSVYPNKPEVTNHANLKNKCINRNLRIINTITISNSKQFQDASTTAPYSNQRSKSSKKRVRRRKAAETKQTFLKNNDSRNFSEGKKPPESTSKSVNQRSDFLLPYEKASQDGSGFSCILGTTTDSTYAPEKSLDPLPDNIEDEEKFLYGDSNNCFYSQKIMMSEKKELVSEKVKSPPTAKPKNLVISNSKQFQDASITAPYSNQRSKSSKKRVRRRKAAETKQTFLKNNVIEERVKLKLEQELQHKKLFYQRIELDRLSKQQVEMLQKKRKEEDPLLVELNRLKDSIANNVAQLELDIKVLKEKQGELDKVIHSLEMNSSEKSQKLSSECKDSSENNLQKSPQSEETTCKAI